jgi:hypothetical protein
MALIDLDELKSVLGIGDIYPDAEVQGVADAAQNIVLSFLNFNKSAIVAVKIESNVATFTTSAPHSFVVGSALTVTGCGSPFNGSRTVTARTDFTFKTALTNADIKEILLKPAGKALLTSQAALYDTNENARTAALIVAEDIWLTRMGVTGQQGVDFQPAPYRLSRGLITRITGLIANIMDVESLVG